MTSLRYVFTVLAALFVFAPATARAQQGPRDRQTRALIQQAMEDYQSLEIDRALERLRVALRGCGDSGCSPQMLARVHMSMGIVYVGGQQNENDGVASMTRAVQLDASAEPDPLLATPEITAAFRRAQGGTSGSGGRNTSGSSGNTGSSGTSNTTSVPAPSGDLLHTPAPEQLENTPLPVYVETAGGTSPEHVYVHFKGIGMVQYRRAEMQRVANGYGTEIPCGQIIQPSIDYYVTAVDASGSTIASAGSETAPVHVPIVTRRTRPAPSLPGRNPPETCGDECPPGMSGPNCHGGARGNGQLGDPCTSNNACAEGMHCDGGACAPGEPGEEGGGGGGEEPGTTPAVRFPRFSFDLGGGIGAAFLSYSGRPPYAEQRRVVDSMRRFQRYECEPYYCSNTIDPGFSPTFFLALNLRVNVHRRIGLGFGVRFQFDAADWEGASGAPNNMANLLLMARAYYALTPDGFARTNNVVIALFAGGGYGQIEPSPSLPSSVTAPSAHILSGYGNAHLGMRADYVLKNGFHVGGEVTLQFMFPTFLFNADFSALFGYQL
jgi:hypothetical protein